MELSSMVSEHYNLNDLCSHFLSQPEARYLPYCSPDVADVQRFQFTNREFFYCGRLNFKDFVNFVAARVAGPYYDRSIRVVGTIGSGKSHLIAAYVMYMTTLRTERPEAHQVVYIPRCSVTFRSSNFHNLSVELTFAFAKDLREDTNDGRPPTLEYFNKFLRNRKSNSVVYVFDEWNYMLDSKENHVKEWREWIENITANQFRIEVVSVNSRTMMETSDGYVRDEWYWHDGNLKDEEWETWCHDNALLKILEPKERNQLRYMTGGLPLLVSMLASPFTKNDLSKEHDRMNSESNLKKAVDEYYKRGDVMSYPWIYTRLADTTYVIQKEKPHLFRLHIRMMVHSLARVPTENAVTLYDNRFFHYDSSTGLLRCCCGFAEDALRRMLYETQRELFVETLKSLPSDSCKLYDIHSSLRSFALEELVFAMMPMNYHLFLPLKFQRIEGSIRNTDEVMFTGECPSASQLNREGIRLYRPNKWNLKYVDGVIRAYVSHEEGVACALNERYVESMERKRQRSEVILIIAVQITVVPPIQHYSSLQFYTKSRDSLPYCDRYKRGDENVQHHFVWIVPESVSTTELPSGPTNVQQHVRTIESIMTGFN